MPEPSAPELQAQDFYFDGPSLVFTAAYHLKRGYCCGNQCRHCPYDKEGKTSSDVHAAVGRNPQRQTEEDASKILKP